MTDLRKTITKGVMGTVAAGAIALASATPAMAQERHNRDRGVNAGDVIAGAVIIGGIAALAGAFGNDDRRDRRNRNYRDRDHRGDRYDNRRDNRRDSRRGHHRDDRSHNGNRGNGQAAVQRCINTAERQARRFGGYRYADVTQIRDVDRTRNGFRVQGRIEVQGSNHYRGQDSDRGRFTCYVGRGNRPQVEFRGIHGLG